MIPEFYKNREVFITGGSGIVGKSLIEKLLRSCNVGTIYVLLRPKRYATIGERLAELKQDMIFRRLLKEKPNEFDEKIVPIPGDLAEPMMGITSDDIKLLENVTIVFHGAATVRFDEPLRKAIQVNVGGTLEVLKVAETLEKLEVFMHVSTFFSNPYLEYVETKWYEAPMDWQFCLALSRRNDISDETLKTLTRKLITGFPNTYCFTKNIAESLVNDYRGKLPVVICRPSIVMFAVDDPEPGYPTSLSGAISLFAMAGTGLLKTVYIAKGQRCDFAALDTVIKCMMYFSLKSVHMFTVGKMPADIPVFHISSCTHSDLTVEKYVHIAQDYELWKEAALEKNFLIPGVMFIDNHLLYLLLVMFKQVLPALLIDLLLILKGRKPELMKIQRRIFLSMDVLKPFLFNIYESGGINYAQEMLHELYGTEFHMDTLRKWQDFNQVVDTIRNMTYKVREVLFKEDPSTLLRARRIMKIKVISYRLLQIFLAYKLLHHIAKPMISNWQAQDEQLINITEIL